MEAHITLPILAETGFAILDPSPAVAAGAVPASEWTDLEYTAWRSSGITRFAPLTSYSGDIDCNGFWNWTPPRTDKDGVWIPAQTALAPTLVALAQEPGANVGRCRVLELQPNTYADAVYNLHCDDNNRLNPDGEGWVVRGLLNLTDDSDSLLILRTDRFDAATEVRIPLAAGTHIIVDTQRIWHAVWHRGPQPRYALITSWESGPALDAYVAARHGSPHAASVELDAGLVAAAQAEMHRRLDERRRLLESLATPGR